MSIFKCKMCGGTLDIQNGESVAICEYCGTKQTLPKLDNEKRANLYDRANHFRRNDEFDKASNIYEQILNEDNTDAEAYWSLVLCRYGIEYVEDPATRKRMPTINRTQYTSIFDDADYKSALQYADAYQKEVYEEEAKTINEIQKGILAISQKEEPFDIFICYKESDANGRRTHDSVLANDLYHQLTQEGFKVFFSRITLEDKLGIAYEPYIFAALNSAKVMVVIGTKQEYLNSVWVKNEWSRYLALIKNGAEKTLIPAYRDMDPYDLPEEFSHLQAQDMSKLGFMQDLIRGIKKIAVEDTPRAAAQESSAVYSENTSTAPLLKRAFMFLEDSDWKNADDYCERVLDIDPECAEAYLGKLMAELHVRKQDGLADCAKPFDSHITYQKIVRFGDKALKTNLAGYITAINNRREECRLSNIYHNANDAMNHANNEKGYKEAAEIFASIKGYKNADELREQCLEKSVLCRKEAIYASALRNQKSNIIHEVQHAASLFKQIPDWKDSSDRITACECRIEEIKAEEKRKLEEAEIKKRLFAEKAKRIKKISIILAGVIFIIILSLYIFYNLIIPAGRYSKAMGLFDSNRYDEALTVFVELGDYKDSISKITEIEYAQANSLLESGNYNEALNFFEKLGDYKDSETKLISLEDKLNGINTKEVKSNLLSAKVGDTVKFGLYEQDSDTSNGKEKIKWVVLAKDNNKILVISKYCLDYQPYNTTYADVTWETCSLRTWLNNDFYKSVFWGSLRNMVVPTNIITPDNLYYSTKGGNDTNDNVFLLSISEINIYFDSIPSEKLFSTTYAEAQRASIDINHDAPRYGPWLWLRSPGGSQFNAASIDTFYGAFAIKRDGNPANDFGFVRPALWITLN